MSLLIDVDQVTRVLIAGRWWDVADNSFTLDAYEYVWRHRGVDRAPLVEHGGGESGVCATGFRFKVAGDLLNESRFIAGPLTAIQAVEHP